MTEGYAAVVLAGGESRRLGGRDKPGLPVGGRPMLRRVLDAVADAAPRVVVGPARSGLPADVVQAREHPPGGGPVAALAAGLATLVAGSGQVAGSGEAAGSGKAAGSGEVAGFVAVLAADLPFLTAAEIGALRRAAATGGLDGAVLVDAEGRQQWLCGVWRTAALRDRVAELDPPAGRSMRALMSGLRVRGVDHPATAFPPPWYDCDTEDDYRRAEEWT
ncbi:molybdenum cofactor guanylyltransferase [Planosporangium thailandense]|uniref:molybdenum cofactor guanylyltransferase n=1 Tax=Planosporangium thailandense TaxID=765197 RepID=UPI0030B84B9C